jgi:hypothetical protein
VDGAGVVLCPIPDCSMLRYLNNYAHVWALCCDGEAGLFIAWAQVVFHFCRRDKNIMARMKTAADPSLPTFDLGTGIAPDQPFAAAE